MKSTEILVKEHILILKYLDILKLSKENLEKGKEPLVPFYKLAVQFSKYFADQFHHFKEEYLMFGLLAQKKEGTLDGQIGELRYQHERCRYCMGEIEKIIQRDTKMDEVNITHLLEHLASYISLLERHIYLEDHIFFPLVNKNLSEENDKYLTDQFAVQEKNMEAPDFSGTMKELVEQMQVFVIQ